MAYCNLDKIIYETDNVYGIPEIEPVYQLPDIKQWIGFNYVKTEKYCKKRFGVHFCLDDYQFETIWNHPNKYIENFQNCGVICSPDFSLYSDFPLAIQIYNHYRKHWLAKFYQNKGITVIPTIAWSTEDSFAWCFDGEPHNSIIAVSSTGVMRDKVSLELFMNGYNEMLKRLRPKKIICFTSNKNCDNLNLQGDVLYINTNTFRQKPEKDIANSQIKEAE